MVHGVKSFRMVMKTADKEALSCHEKSLCRTPAVIYCGMRKLCGLEVMMYFVSFENCGFEMKRISIPAETISTCLPEFLQKR